MMSLGVGIPLLQVPTAIPHYLFDLIHILKLFSAFSYMCQFPIGWTSKFHTFQPPNKQMLTHSLSYVQKSYMVNNVIVVYY